MDYSKYSIEDFLLDDRFRKWIINPEKSDNIFWENWLAKNPSRASDLIAARKVLLNLSMKNYKLGEAGSNDLWNKIEKQIDVTDDTSFETKIIPINPESVLKRSEKNRQPAYWWLRLASILLLLIVASVVWIRFNTPFESPKKGPQNLVEKATEPGMKSQITLSDGTLVVLNAGSKLSYLPRFTDKSRDVYLEGEAYFDVAKDRNRPFNVYAGDVVTTAIGTEFNVNSYQDGGNDVLIALVEGKVSVKQAGIESSPDSHDNKQHILLPGNKASYNPVSEKFTLSAFDIKEETVWKEGILLFANAEAPEVFTRLERWYGVKIIFKNTSDKKLNYSAEFKKQNIHQVLTSLSFTLAFDYKIEDSNIYVTYKTL